MVKVCHMTSAHGSEDVRIFKKECASLANAGYEVYQVARGDSGEVDGIHKIGIGEVSGGRVKRMLQVTKLVYQKAEELDADIYHFHDPELLPYGLKLKRKGKIVIFDSHEHTAGAIHEKQWIPGPLRFLVHAAYSAYQAYVCRRIDAVISVTPHLIEYFQDISSNVVQVANYPFYRKSEKTPDFHCARVAFAGGISEQWNHERILRSLERIPECRYCLCGKSSEKYLDLLKRLPAWKQVDYLGTIPHEAVALELQKSSIGLALLQPGNNTDHKNGTMGNTKIFEEMMAGLPIICTDFVLWKEFVERYHCGICVNPENVDEIACAIRYLLDHPEEAKQMGENGRRAIQEEFNWSVEEKKLLALYADLLEK